MNTYAVDDSVSETVSDEGRQLLDPQAAPHVVGELLRRRRLTQTYIDDFTETQFLLWLYGGHFTTACVVAALSAMAYFYSVVDFAVKSGGVFWTSIFQGIVGCLLAVMAITRYLFFARRASVIPALSYKGQRAFIHRAELQVVCIGILLPALVIPSPTLEQYCDPHLRYVCGEYIYAYVLTTTLAPILLIAYRAKFSIPINACVPVVYFVSSKLTEHLSGVNAPFDTKRGRFVHVVVQVCFQLCILFGLAVSELTRRSRFEKWVETTRRSSALHEQQHRLASTLTTLLPGDAIAKLNAHRPIMDQRAECVVGVSRFADIAHWSGLHLPEEAAWIIDGLLCTFDKYLERHADCSCEKVKCTGDSFIFSVGLRGEIEGNAAAAAERAVVFALWKQRVVARVSAVAELGLATGISHGPATGTLIGAPTLHYMITGPATTKAFQLVYRTKPRSCLVSAEVEGLVRDRFQFSRVGDEAFELVARIPDVNFACGKRAAVHEEAGSTVPDEQEHLSVSTSSQPVAASIVSNRQAFLFRRCREWAAKSNSTFEEKDSAAIVADAESDLSVYRYGRYVGTFDSNRVEGEYWEFASTCIGSSRAADLAISLIIPALLLFGMLALGERGVVVYVFLGCSLVVAAIRWFLFRFATSWIARADALLALLHAVVLLVGVRQASNDNILNVNLVYMQVVLSISILLAGNRVPWAYSVASLTAITLLAFGLTPIAIWTTEVGPFLCLSWLITAYAAWDKETSQRASFATAYLGAATMKAIQQDTLMFEALLIMVVPEHMVSKVALKTDASSCLSHFIDDAVILEYSLPLEAFACTATMGWSIEAMEAAMRCVEHCMEAAGFDDVVGLLRIVGDTWTFFGPHLRGEPARDTEAAFASAALYKGARRVMPATEILRHAARNRQQLDSVEHSSRKAASTLFKFLLLMEAQTDPSLTTAIMECEAGFAAAVGHLQPSFDIVGVVSRNSSALLRAAPVGYKGLTARCANQIDGVLGEKSTWCVRGVGVVEMVMVSFGGLAGEQTSLTKAM